MGPLLYSIECEWWNRPEPPHIIGEKYLLTLDQLERLDPTFRDWGTSDGWTGDSPYTIESRRGDIAGFVSAHVVRDRFGTADSRIGYRVHAAAGGSLSRSVSFIAKAGSLFGNAVKFRVGSPDNPPDRTFISYAMYKAALLGLISTWTPVEASARCSIWGDVPPTLPGEPPFPYSQYQMPWIAYLDVQRAAAIDVPAGIATERTPDGGLLMTATEGVFDPTNIDHMRPSRLIAEIMIKQGKDFGA